MGVRGVVLSLLWLSLLAATRCADLPPKLKQAVAAASEAQTFRQKASTVAHEVESAPAAPLSGGTGDIDTTGACADDINLFCPLVKPGYSHIAECLDNRVEDEQEGTVSLSSRISAPCVEDLLRFKMNLSANINMNLKMATACKQDVTKHCQEMKGSAVPGAVVACLKMSKPALSSRCRKEVTAAQLAAAKDFRLDAVMYAACKEDAKAVCGDVPSGSGRVSACLRDHRKKISWDCQKELFRESVEVADDIRLSVELLDSCISEKREFCKDVEPGGARVKDCLESSMDKPGFGGKCRQAMNAMVEARARDFRLDVHIRTHCDADIESLCQVASFKSDAVSNEDGRVILCLQDLRDDISNLECRKAVKAAIERGAADIRFDVALAEACVQDRNRLCANVQPGSARVIRCLQERRQELMADCSVELFTHEMRVSEDIDFNVPLKRACSVELESNCEARPDGAEAIFCLIDAVSSPSMSKSCAKSVVWPHMRPARQSWAVGERQLVVKHFDGLYSCR